MRHFIKDRDSLFGAFHGAYGVSGEVIRPSKTEQRIAFPDTVADLPTERELLSEVWGVRAAAKLLFYFLQLLPCVSLLVFLLVSTAIGN